ncbi:MAG: hypothetical protein GX466_08945 [Candidatus Cloacimonetes bacterium]|nr:hypothetical protein [Candidatus Cloacimonadota bacterium]
MIDPRKHAEMCEAAFSAGRASREAEIAALRQQLTEALDENLRLQVVADDVRSAYAKALRDTENELRQQLAAKQAEVDALMLEYCPSEMSQEQLDTWAAHQRPAKEN